jgi:hypothetical protein
MDGAPLEGPPGMKSEKVGDAKERTIAGHRFVEVQHRIESVNVHTVGTIAAERAFFVRVYSRKSLPSKWKGIDERILATVRVP